MDQAEIAGAFLKKVAERFADAHRRLSATLSPLSADELGFRPHSASNRIGNRVLHLCGHLRAGYLGEAQSRDRPGEFLAEGPFEPATLLALVDETFSALGRRLGALGSADLTDTQRRDGPEDSLLDSLIYSLAHTTEHVGQVIALAKAGRPQAMAPLWGSPVRRPPGGPAGA